MNHPSLWIGVFGNLLNAFENFPRKFDDYLKQNFVQFEQKYVSTNLRLCCSVVGVRWKYCWKFLLEISPLPVGLGLMDIISKWTWIEDFRYLHSMSFSPMTVIIVTKGDKKSSQSSLESHVVCFINTYLFYLFTNHQCISEKLIFSTVRCSALYLTPPRDFHPAQFHL